METPQYDLSYALDTNGDEVLLKDHKHHVVMEWEKPYMKACIDALAPKGDVLEIGYGCGYSASFIQAYYPRTHTIVECHPVVIEKANSFSALHAGVYIVDDTWQNALEYLGVFDTIFFDDYPLEPNAKWVMADNKTESRNIHERLLPFLKICLKKHMRIGSKFSCFIEDINFPGKEELLKDASIKYKESYVPVMPPKHCKYYQEKKALVITVEKLS